MRFKVGDRIYIDGEKWCVVDTTVKSPSGLDVEAVNESDCTLFICFSSDDADDIKPIVRGDV